MEKIGEKAYRVPSDSNANKNYIVLLEGDDGNITCTCPSYAIRRNKVKSGKADRSALENKYDQDSVCKHIVQVLSQADAMKNLHETKEAEKAIEIENDFEWIRAVESLKRTAEELS